MTTQVTTSLPIWLAGCTYDGNGGNDLRASGVAAFFYDQGIVTGSTIETLAGVIGGAGLAVSAGTGMTVNVQPGHFVVPCEPTPTSGAYASTLTSSATLTVQTADPSYSRIDAVCAYVQDNGNSSSYGAVEIITGTPASAPSAPSTPNTSIVLAYLTVPAAVTAVTSGMISDQRSFTTTTGGVLVAEVGSATGYKGQLAYDPGAGRFYHNNNISSATQMRVLPWNPVIVTRSSNFNFSGAETPVLSTTFTSDGYTDVEIFFKWPGVLSSRGSAYNFNTVFRMYIDNVQVDGYLTPDDQADGNIHSGGSWSYYTSGATGDTPAAGSHTVKVTCQNMSGNYSTSVYGFSNNKIILRVEPVAM